MRNIYTVHNIILLLLMHNNNIYYYIHNVMHICIRIVHEILWSIAIYNNIILYKTIMIKGMATYMYT